MNEDLQEVKSFRQAGVVGPSISRVDDRLDGWAAEEGLAVSLSGQFRVVVIIGIRHHRLIDRESAAAAVCCHLPNTAGFLS